MQPYAYTLFPESSILRIDTEGPVLYTVHMNTKTFKTQISALPSWEILAILSTPTADDPSIASAVAAYEAAGHKVFKGFTYEDNSATALPWLPASYTLGS